MNLFYIVSSIILLSLLYSIIRCVVLKNILDKASKIIGLYLLLTLITELLAFMGIILYRYNIPIYNTYSIVQFYLLTIYFSQTTILLRKKATRNSILLLGTFIYIQDSIVSRDFMLDPNSGFLAFESISFVCFSLIYFYDVLNEKSESHILSQHFWFTGILLTFWSFTLLSWLVGLTIYQSLKDNSIILNYMMWAINIITYTGFGLVFLFYRKLLPR
jgi:hypothetical protein